MPTKDQIKQAILDKKGVKGNNTASNTETPVVAPSKPLESIRSFVLVTSDWSGLGFADQEIRQNGSEVIVAYKPKEPIEDPEKKESYEIQGQGIVPTMELDKIFKKRGDYKDAYWVFDGNHNVDIGEKLIEEGFKVFNGSQFQYDLENDREYGLQFAEEVGLHSPPYHEFKSVEEGIKFLEANENKAFVFKPNGAEDSALTQTFKEEDEDT